jgi:hypothetical protein
MWSGDRLGDLEDEGEVGRAVAFGGVPTAMKIDEGSSIASTMSVVKRRRPGRSFLWMSSSRPGS